MRKKPVFALIEAALLFTIVEVAVRLSGMNLGWISDLSPHDQWNHGYTPRYRGHYTTSDGHKFSVHYNQHGLSQKWDVKIPKPLDIYRILVLGDSFMAAFGLEYSVPTFLHEQLQLLRTEHGGKRIEVINAGQSSYSALLHRARYLNQYTYFEPDAVLIFPDLTDVYDDWIRYRWLLRDDRSVAASPAMLRYYRLMRQMGFEAPFWSFRLIVKCLIHGVGLLNPSVSDDLFAHARLENGGEDVAFSVAALRDLAQVISQDGATVAFFVYPHLEQITGVFNRIYEEHIEDMCREENIPFVSVHQEIASAIEAGMELYRPDDMHFNLIGFQLLGDLVLFRILQNPREYIGVGLVSSVANESCFLSH